MNRLFIACNHCVQRSLHAIAGLGGAYCTQQTGGLTRGMTLRAIHTEAADRVREPGVKPPLAPPLDIACNPLTYVFARLGLPPLVEAFLEVLLVFVVVNKCLFHVVFLLGVLTPRSVGPLRGVADLGMRTTVSSSATTTVFSSDAIKG
jgi:hypothetical protein